MKFLLLVAPLLVTACGSSPSKDIPCNASEVPSATPPTGVSGPQSGEDDPPPLSPNPSDPNEGDDTSDNDCELDKESYDHPSSCEKDGQDHKSRSDDDSDSGYWEHARNDIRLIPVANPEAKTMVAPPVPLPSRTDQQRALVLAYYTYDLIQLHLEALKASVEAQYLEESRPTDGKRD